jgi:Uma2 family endonuclease
MTTKAQLLTIADWDAMPYDEWHRYEIIEGELFVSCSPGLTHQMVSDNLLFEIRSFLETNPIGTIVSTPGLVLSNISGVIPDLVYFSDEQRETIVVNDRLHGPPALVAELLSPGSTNKKRDRIAKLQLYAKHNVGEYWIIDPLAMTLEKYVNQHSSLVPEEVLRYEDTLTTAVLPGFSCPMSKIFKR